MVPPEVTARRCAPGRAVSRPVSRCQTSRGRSSAKSSLGYRPLSMSSTASNALCGSSRKLSARRTSAYSSSALVSSMATMATICWASTSSGLRSSATSSMAPCRIRSTTTADSTRSPRWLGKKTPRDVAPTW